MERAFRFDGASVCGRRVQRPRRAADGSQPLLRPWLVCAANLGARFDAKESGAVHGSYPPISSGQTVRKWRFLCLGRSNDNFENHRLAFRDQLPLIAWQLGE